MAPSSSQIVWTVIIGVIIIAMAIGNVWGGKLTDQAKSPDRLYRHLILAAIWIAPIPFVGRWLIGGVSLLLAAFVTKNFLVWAVLATCLLIFAFPCVLLSNTNTEAFRTDSDDWQATLSASIARLTDADYAAMMKTVSGKLTEYQGGDCILTDDKAPVEVLDELIEGELNYYRDQVKTNGLLSLIS